LNQQRASVKEKLSRAENSLRYSIPRHIYRGINAVEEIVRRERVQGYYGPIYELITLKDAKFTTAVEVGSV